MAHNDTTPMTLSSYINKRAMAQAYFVGEVHGIRTMLADAIISAERTVELLAAAEQRLDAAFATISAEWDTSREGVA